MKVAFTQIIGVESDDNSVLIKFRPQGSDTADNPLTVRVTPHDSYIHVNTCLTGRDIDRVENGPNIVNIFYGEDWRKDKVEKPKRKRVQCPRPFVCERDDNGFFRIG